MQHLAPKTGHPEVVYAKDQPEYNPAVVDLIPVEHRSRYLVTRWRPTVDELEALNRGEDIFVAQLNFMNRDQGHSWDPMTPLRVQVGMQDFKKDG